MPEPTESSDRLTRETVLAATDKVREARPTACIGSDQHVFHPAEVERGGWARCANCFGVVYLPTENDRSEARDG
jgi:hypothetical protein